jgi:hypothetical protein
VILLKGKEINMKKLLLILLLTAVVAVVGVLFCLGPIVKTAIEEGGEYAFGTKTTVNAVDIALLGGSIQINEMAIANPAGYESAHFYKMGKARVAVSVPSLSSDVVEIQEIILSDMNVALERKGSSFNAKELLDHAKSKGSSAETSSAPSSDSSDSSADNSSSGSTKKFVVKRLLIESVSMTAKLGLPISGADTSMTLPSIELTDIGNAGEGVDFTELSERVMQAIMSEAAKSGQLGDLNKMLDEKLDQVKAQAKREIEAKKAEVKKKLTEGLGDKANELLKNSPF